MSPQEFAAREAIFQALGQQVQRDFDLARSHRLEIERRWVKDLRQYKGQYDPDVQFADGRSQLFLRLTRAKVKSTNARMGDMLFPAGDKNWTLRSSPVPTIDMAQYADEIAAIIQQHGEMDEEALEEAINAVAKEACEEMSEEIDDQLEEGGYEAECRKVINSGNLFGTGILKGPMGTPKRSRRWQRTAGAWNLADHEEMKPGFSFVPIWRYYPDPAATERKDCRFEIEAHPLLKAEFMALAKDPAFMADKIREALRKYPDGNVTSLEPWEHDLRTANKNEQNKPLPTNIFRVLERWGSVPGRVLAAAGMKVPDEEQEYEGQVWVIGDIVIRAQINPYDSGSRPFKIYYLDKDESSIWGEGIPSIMSDPQKAANTSVRALVDNAAASAIPMFEVNTSLMPNESDTSSILAGRVWHREGKGADSQYDAIRAVEIPAKTEQFISLLRLFIEMADEVTTMPRYTYGSNDGSSVSKTVGGLSMLMGQANISLKDLVKNWDDGVTTPFITDMRDWNMQFNSKDSIKGDFDVIARGSSSLVAKEVRANALAEFTMDLIKGAPNLGKMRDLYAERARNLDLDPDAFLKSQKEMDADNMAMVAQEALVKLAEGLGLEPQALVQNMDQFIATAKEMMAMQQQIAGAMQPAAQPAPVAGQEVANA